MATWKKVIVSGSDAILNKLNVGTNQQISTAQSTTFLTGSFTGSFKGDGSNLTGIIATSFDIDNLGSDLTAITVAGTDKLALSDNGTEGRINVSQLSTPLAGTGLEANSGTIRIATAAAGAGLTGGSGSALRVGEGSHITVNADDVAVNTTTLTPAISGSIFTQISGDLTITAGGVAAIGSGVIVNADVNAAAAIVYTKLNLASSGIVSGSTLAAGSGQGSTTLTTNGVSSGDITATGLGTAGTPTFAGLTITNGNIAINNTTSTALTTTGTTAAVFNTTATTVNAFGAATTINLGAATGTTTVGNSLVVTGDLQVNGDLVTLNTANLNVEDKFILLNSGSSTATDESGIIFGGANGTAGTGTALIWNGDYNSNDGRLAIANLVGATDSTATVSYYIAGVFDGTEANAATAQADHNGNIRIESGDIFIYS